MNQLVPIIGDRPPALVAAAGARASYRFFEFFTANIRNPNTRRAYARAAAARTIPDLRYHGANAPSVGLTLYRLGDDNALDRFGIKDGIWRKVTWCRRWSTSGPRLPA